MAWVRKMEVYMSQYSDRSKQRNHLGDIRVGRKITLKCTLKEKCGFNWLRIENIGLML
jgi:hypothetical protein